MKIPYERGIIFVIIALILIICFFAPLNDDDIEGFGMINMGKNMNIYGPVNELNLSSIQSSFPFYKPIPEHDGKVKLIKSDGVVLGGYMPQILRPFDSVSATSTSNSCKWPCYSNKKYQTWCSEDNAIRYHAMRPIIQPNEYNKLLTEMFEGIVEPEEMPEGMQSIAVFCGDTIQQLMSIIMEKIAIQVSKMPMFNKNSSWGSENFVYTDVDLYEYSGKSGIYYKIIFNLYNPQRSISSLVVATMRRRDAKLIAMNFVNENKNKTTPGISMSTGIMMPEKLDPHEDLNPLNEFDWNYKNTLIDKKFNKHGFFSNNPKENIEIEGGVPDSLRSALAGNCSEANLMSCTTPDYTGIQESTGRPAPIDGTVKNVYLNPKLVYSRKIESPEGNNYF